MARLTRNRAILNVEILEDRLAMSGSPCIVALMPVVNPIDDGELQTTPVIAADRRVVRLDLKLPFVPVLITPPVAPPPVLPPDWSYLGGAAGGLEDGLESLGGTQELQDGKNDAGTPALSKIPYVNRLFKNVGYGRETESLLLMVTPRIVIEGEE